VLPVAVGLFIKLCVVPIDRQVMDLTVSMCRVFLGQLLLSWFMVFRTVFVVCVCQNNTLIHPPICVGFYALIAYIGA
jgi:hypothetical protein